MIITVSPGEKIEIPGIASEATVQLKGDEAWIAVELNSLIMPPYRAQTLTFLNSDWIVLRTLEKTRQTLTFTCSRRLTSG